jgi:hypothetical protein
VNGKSMWPVTGMLDISYTIVSLCIGAKYTSGSATVALASFVATAPGLLQLNSPPVTPGDPLIGTRRWNKDPSQDCQVVRVNQTTGVLDWTISTDNRFANAGSHPKAHNVVTCNFQQCVVNCTPPRKDFDKEVLWDRAPTTVSNIDNIVLVRDHQLKRTSSPTPSAALFNQRNQPSNCSGSIRDLQVPLTLAPALIAQRTSGSVSPVSEDSGGSAGQHSHSLLQQTPWPAVELFVCSAPGRLSCCSSVSFGQKALTLSSDEELSDPHGGFRRSHTGCTRISQVSKSGAHTGGLHMCVQHRAHHLSRFIPTEIASAKLVTGKEDCDLVLYKLVWKATSAETGINHKPRATHDVIGCSLSCNQRAPRPCELRPRMLSVTFCPPTAQRSATSYLTANHSSVSCNIQAVSVLQTVIPFLGAHCTHKTSLLLQLRTANTSLPLVPASCSDLSSSKLHPSLIGVQSTEIGSTVQLIACVHGMYLSNTLVRYDRLTQRPSGDAPAGVATSTGTVAPPRLPSGGLMSATFCVIGGMSSLGRLVSMWAAVGASKVRNYSKHV